MVISFSAPEVDQPTELAFRLTVTDTWDQTAQASVSILVNPAPVNHTQSFSADFSASGTSLTGFWMFDPTNAAGVASIPQSSTGVEVTQTNGRYRAAITSNSHTSLFFQNAQGRLDGVRVSFPFEVIARNVGIGITTNSQQAPGPGGFRLAGLQVHNADFNSVNYAHLVVGHAGNGRQYMVEAKHTRNGSSIYDYTANDVLPQGRADLRLVGNADRSITAYWQVPAMGGADNWIAYEGDLGTGPGRLPGPTPVLGNEVIVGLLTYASGGVGSGFVGTADAFSVQWTGAPLVPPPDEEPEEPEEPEEEPGETPWNPVVFHGDRFYVIGNSLIGSRGGMHNKLRLSLQQAPLYYSIDINLPTEPPPGTPQNQFDGFYYGQGLGFMYNRLGTHTDIAEGDFDTVMTISGSATEMQNYYNLIAPTGAHHLVYQTWGWPNNPANVGLTNFRNNIQAVIDTTRTFENTNPHAIVAPTGYVFYELTRNPIPGITRVDYLFDPNNNHQSLLGNLVGAYVVYSTLTGRSPADLDFEFTNWGISITRSADQVIFSDPSHPTMTFSREAIDQLQTRVWQLVQNWKTGSVILTPP